MRFRFHARRPAPEALRLKRSHSRRRRSVAARLGPAVRHDVSNFGLGRLEARDVVGKPKRRGRPRRDLGLFPLAGPTLCSTGSAARKQNKKSNGDERREGQRECVPRVLDLRRRRGPSYLFGVAAKLTISLSTPTPEYLRLERSIVPHSVPLLLRRRRFELDALPRARVSDSSTAHPPWRAKRQLVPRAPPSLFSLLASLGRLSLSLSLSVCCSPLLNAERLPLGDPEMKFHFFFFFFSFFFSRLRFSDHRSTESHPQTPHKALARQGGRSWARGDRRAGGLGSRAEGRVDLDERGGRSWPLSMRRATASSVSRSASRGDGRNIEIET